MKRLLIAFDLDGTLAVTKSPISDAMTDCLGRLLSLYEVCVISGGTFEQFKTQLIDRLDVGADDLTKLHILPTSGTRYLRFDPVKRQWIVQYSEDLAPEQRRRIIDVLTAGAKSLGYWESDPHGDIIEDRGSQITFSALGQQAPAEAKYAWDPDGTKKEALRDYAATRLTDLEVHAGGTTSIDVTGAGIDKAYGMNKMMSILHLSKAEILFMGDKLEKGGNDYPVKAMGIDTIAVDGWEQCALVINAIIAVAP